MPHRGGLNAYECCRLNGSLRFRCKACRADFTLTSGTLFASHKLRLLQYLAAIVIFCNEVKGKSALALSRGDQLQERVRSWPQTREAMTEEMRGRTLAAKVRSPKLMADTSSPRTTKTTASIAA